MRRQPSDDGREVHPSVQETADLAAACRAAETTRSAPRLRDPFASRLVSTPDRRHRALLSAGCDEVIARTALIDELLVAALAADDNPATVVNLGAGLCTRPYRLAMTSCRLVLELDAAPVLERKERALAGEHPTCPVRRQAVDLRDAAAVRRLVAAGQDAGPTVVISEGVLPYLTSAELATLAATLAAVTGPVTWLADVVSGESAAAMAALSAQAGAPVPLYGLTSLAPFEQAGWRVAGYRILPVARRGALGGRPAGAGPASRQVVDGVLRLTRDLPEGRA